MAQQRLVSEQDVHEAQRRIREAVSAGTLSEQEGAERAEAVVHAVTPHDLYEASGGLAGEAHMSRAAAREWKTVALVIAALVILAVVMAVVIIVLLR
jgi:hypothetical protein